jgi:DNA-binding MarR family transcriptional regulator
MLLRIRRHGSVEPGVLAERSPVPLEAVLAAARQVEERRLAERRGLELYLTASGREAAERLAVAREESLAELLGDWWQPGRSTDLTKQVRELSAELCGAESEPPHKASGHGLS